MESVVGSADRREVAEARPDSRLRHPPRTDRGGVLMGSPYRADQLSPQMRERYGLDRSNWLAWTLSLGVVGAFVAALAWVGFQVLSPSVGYSLLTWDVVSPERVTVVFEVQRSAEADVYCVVRAQDESRADVGYAVVALPRGTTYVQETYELRTLAPAYIVEVLACEAGAPPQRVIPPQFPFGVVPPEQPWTPA